MFTPPSSRQGLDRPLPHAVSAGDLDHLSSADSEALLLSARWLLRSRHESSTRQVLRGRNVGLVFGAGSEQAAELFTRAASGLGARVSLLSAERTAQAAGADGQQMAQLLGRLYDAIECQSVPPEVVAAIGRAAGVPVYLGLATPEHPTAALAALLQDAEPEERRGLIVQAVLIATIRPR